MFSKVYQGNTNKVWLGESSDAMCSDMKGFYCKATVCLLIVLRIFLENVHWVVEKKDVTVILFTAYGFF